MTATYDCIATTTVGTATNTVTFNNISGTFTDLVLVIDGTLTGQANKRIEFNGVDTNQSSTLLYGNGTTAASARYIGAGSAYLDALGAGTNRYTCIVHIFNYANTTTNKTYISRNDTAAVGTEAIVGLWQSTSAITSFNVKTTANNFASGTTFSLYGIKSE